MIRYALMSYMPKRYLRKANFETLMDDNFIWDFKDGRKWAKVKAANMVAQALSAQKLQDSIFMCIPASCQRTYTRRCKTFSAMVSEKSGMVDGFTLVKVNGKRDKLHTSSNRANKKNDTLVIDAKTIKGKNIVLFDDVVTTGKSCNEFKDKLETLGAKVTVAIFLGKTKKYRYSSC